MKQGVLVSSLVAMATFIACASPIAPQDKSEVASKQAALDTAAAHACGDHADDDDAQPADTREAAAKPVSWRKKGEKKGRVVQAKVLGFNDFHGQLPEGRLVAGRPVGGAAVLASYLKSAAQGFDGRALIIHAGDHVGASPPESALLQDEPAIQFLNTLTNAECDGPTKGDRECNVIGTLGNHEFDEGKDELLRLIFGGNHASGPFLQNPYRGARFPYVNANVVVQGKKRDKNLILPYVIRKLDGVRVGVIGAVLKETPTIVTPTGVAGLSFLDEATAINEQVAELKCKGVHTIIVTIHQGAPQSPSYTTPTDPAASVGAPISTIVSKLDDEVDLVISGHSHAFTNALVPTASGHQILVTQAFSASTAYADIDLELDRASGDVLSKTARIVTTYSDQAPGNVRDPAVQAIVEQAKALTAPLVNRPIANFSADVTRTQTTAGESALGNLIADAQRAAMGTDFAFMNPGGIRADLLYAKSANNPADADGVALWGELFTIQPFGNSLVRLNMTGQQIYDLLNQQFAVNRFLQISGLTYTWDASLPAANRIVEVRKDGSPIDRAAIYTVTANNFIAAGGDGFTTFLSGTGNVGGLIDLDAFIDYLSTLPQPFTPPALGRITRLN
ncbi:MAG: bifunctional metallophosphatase/5'-nucleotidase [Myxococcota bacterium]